MAVYLDFEKEIKELEIKMKNEKKNEMREEMRDKRSAESPFIHVQQLTKHYGELAALRQIEFSLTEGKTLGIVGESGCGKSTLAKVLTLLESFTEGQVRLGRSLVTAKNQIS